MSTEAQQSASRANAQLSTGPKTAEGKAKVAHNAVKTALTGATVLLPTDDATLYAKHIAEVFANWKPADHQEHILVQMIADAEWRLLRIPALIAATLALSRIKNADLFADHPEEVRSMLLEAHVQEACGRELRNLSLQESRLARKREKDIAELREIQKERRRREEPRPEPRHSQKPLAQPHARPMDPAREFGFDFSHADMERRARETGRSLGEVIREELMKNRKNAA